MKFAEEVHFLNMLEFMLILLDVFNRKQKL